MERKELIRNGRRTKWVNANCVEKKGVEWKQTTKSLDALWFARSAGQSCMRRTTWQRISALLVAVAPFASRVGRGRGKREDKSLSFLSLFYLYSGSKKPRDFTRLTQENEVMGLE